MMNEKIKSHQPVHRSSFIIPHLQGIPRHEMEAIQIRAKTDPTSTFVPQPAAIGRA